MVYLSQWPGRLRCLSIHLSIHSDTLSQAGMDRTDGAPWLAPCDSEAMTRGSSESTPAEIPPLVESATWSAPSMERNATPPRHSPPLWPRSISGRSDHMEGESDHMEREQSLPSVMNGSPTRRQASLPRPSRPLTCTSRTRSSLRSDPPK